MSDPNVNRFVVDTNVLAVAEGLHDEASDACVLACVNALDALRSGTIAVVDAGDEIVTEYITAMSGAHPPKIGTKFAKWLYRSRYNTSVCEQVPISPTNGADPSYAEFPSDPGLATFDADDRKFVAVACSHPERPPILEAVDQQWWQLRADLVRAGVDVQFLCLREISGTS